MSTKAPATRRTQLLTLLYSMKQQGKELEFDRILYVLHLYLLS